jgi:hypothetical protein
MFRDCRHKCPKQPEVMPKLEKYKIYIKRKRGKPTIFEKEH